jgi:serine/threonine protein kinase
MSSRQDQPPPPDPPLFDGSEADTVRATQAELKAAADKAAAKLAEQIKPETSPAKEPAPQSAAAKTNKDAVVMREPAPNKETRHSVGVLPTMRELPALTDSGRLLRGTPPLGSPVMPEAAAKDAGVAKPPPPWSPGAPRFTPPKPMPQPPVASSLSALSLPDDLEPDEDKIDTDRQRVPSELMRTPPLASDELRRELSDGGFSRIDTLPDGFADILKRRTLQVGDVVGGRYKLVEVLGGGAMGHVFVAENQAIGSRVAIKVLKPELLASPEFRQRFQYEAQAVGSIEHPNVARFLDVVVGDPTFLVMEYVPGETLFTVLSREKSMSIQRAVHITTRLAWGLDAAHAAGIIHRDLKPANVILTADREVGETPKLIDFGLAKIAATQSTEQLTRTGQIIGTPAYMSPEQISGREVDPRSDVYALACLLYEMIAGRPPFTGSDDVQTLYRQLHEPPEPLSLNAGDVPAALDKVVNRALSKSPHDRFGSMQELARGLNAAVEKRRPGAHGETSMTAMPPMRYRLVWVALAFVMGVAMAAAAWAWRGRERPIATVAAGGTILVTSDPLGGTVTVDGRPVKETTPTAVTGLANGTHVVRVSMAGRTAIEQHAALDAEHERAVVQVALPAASHAVRVESVPSGALVYVNGILQIGQTPVEIKVSDDEFYRIQLEREGFELTSRALTPDDKAPVLTVELQPEKAQRGTLMLESDVVAEVWVDGENSGFVSPTLFRLTAGDHTLQLRESDEPRSSTVRVKIKAGKVSHLTLKGTRG